MSSDGTTALLITDKGALIEVAFDREEGALATVRVLRMVPLRHRNGRRLRQGASDAEALARAPDGNLFVSFEHRHRVAKLAYDSAHTELLPDHPNFPRFAPNKGLEALAVHPDGTLYALPEGTDTPSAPFPIFTFRNGRWQQDTALPRRGPFVPVGADFDDAARLYVLERALSPLGFRSRIRKLTFNKDGMRDETLLTTGPNRFDNLEAISLWRDAEGDLRLTLVSDDNFLRIQRTQIVEFRVEE